MNIIDSSGWLEYFADGPNAILFSQPLRKTAELIVPTVTIYEVFKTVLRQRDESNALQAIALMEQGSVIDLTANISILAAKISPCEWGEWGRIFILDEVLSEFQIVNVSRKDTLGAR